MKKDINNFLSTDTINNWNKLYGKNGFAQVQLLIKKIKIIKIYLQKLLIIFVKKDFILILQLQRIWGR